MPGVYDNFAEESAHDTANLLERRGYKAIRYAFSMVRPDLENIPDCPLPEGLEVRPYQTGAPAQDLGGQQRSLQGSLGLHCRAVGRV